MTPPPPVNELLRSHVTRVGFDLTLGKSQIAALIYLELCINNKSSGGRASVPGRNILSPFIAAVRALQDRGLVVHHFTVDPKTGFGKIGLHHHYTITRAGACVLDLLEESGLYQEYLSSLSAFEVVA